MHNSIVQLTQLKDCSEIVVDGDPIIARKVKHWLSRNGVIGSRNGVVG